MERTCIHIQDGKNGLKRLYIDSENANEILNFLNENIKRQEKFQLLIEVILNHNPTRDQFGHEKISKDTDSVYAIKIKVHPLNSRIYCKTYQNDTIFHIVMCELYKHKNTQKLTKEIKDIINKVATYEYDIS